MTHRILIIRFGSLGDLILTSATVLNLRLAYPESEILFLTREKFRTVVECFGTVDEILTLGDRAGPGDYLRLLLSIDNDNFDLIVDLHGNFRSWFARRTLSATRRIVYPKRRVERLMMVRRKPRPEVPVHTVDAYNDVLRQLGHPVACWRPVFGPEFGYQVETETAKITNADGFIVVAPGAAHPTKQWEMDKFAEVALRAHDKLGARILWLVQSADAGKSGLEGKLPDGAFVECVDWPIDRLARLISTASLMLSNDSGLAHLASAVGLPVIALFGPTHPALGFAPRGLFDRVIEVDEYCRPCSLHGKKACYRDKRYCFDRITTDMVFESVSGLYRRQARMSRAIFLDRDGTVIVDKEYATDPDQIEFEEGAVEGMKRMAGAGFKLVVVSNQSGIGRGFFAPDSVERMNARLGRLCQQQGVDIDAMYYCPHYRGGANGRYGVSCGCRKPAAGMPEEAALQLGLDLRNSYVAGDKLADLNLGRAIGARSFLVRSGIGRKVEARLKESEQDPKQVVFDNLSDVARHIESLEKK